MENEAFKNWEQKKERIKEEYPHIDLKELDYELGKEEEVLKQLQQKLGKTKKEIFNWLHLMG